MRRNLSPHSVLSPGFFIVDADDHWFFAKIVCQPAAGYIADWGRGILGWLRNFIPSTDLMRIARSASTRLEIENYSDSAAGCRVTLYIIGGESNIEDISVPKAAQIYSI